MEVLRISGLRLETLDLSKNKNLRILDVSNNALKTLELCQSPHLKEGVLRCENNNLSEVWLASGVNLGKLWGADKGVVFRNCGDTGN
ncbi:MAG: hypothetical protein LRY55_06300 [Leadbetterella sp.]|nr:hypothetical protein [Leadbetterella sp.]